MSTSATPVNAFINKPAPPTDADVAALDAAPKYPEGTGVRLRVRAIRDVAALKKLAAIKLAN